MVDVNGNYELRDRAKLKKAIASGLLEVEFDGPDGERRVRYRTLKEMKRTLADIEAELGLCTKRTRTTVTSSKGYN